MKKWISVLLLSVMTICSVSAKPLPVKKVKTTTDITFISAYTYVEDIGQLYQFSEFYVEYAPEIEGTYVLQFSYEFRVGNDRTTHWSPINYRQIHGYDWPNAYSEFIDYGPYPPGVTIKLTGRTQYVSISPYYN